MAILSAEELFSDDQAITATAASTNVIDFGSPGTWVHSTIAITDDKGNSCIPFMFLVTEDFDNLTNLKVAIEVDDNAAFGSATEVYSETIVLADLTAGRKSAVRMIPFNSDEQYMRVYYTVTGSAPSAGKVTAGIAQLESAWGNR